MSGEPFQLCNDPPPRIPWRGEEPEKTQQRALFAGLDCLPGQQDLFSTDDENELSNPNQGVQ